MQRWQGAPDSGRWVHQSDLPVPLKEKVSLAEGQTLDPVDLIGFLRPRMAHFMVPRYVRILGDLPKTPTNKIEKYLLRKDGITPDTFDRDAAGIVIKSEAVRSRH